VLLDGVPVAQAYIQFIVQIVVMIVCALISYAMRPKPKVPEAQKSNVPVVDDGKGIIIVFGTVWIDDSIVLGWKDLDPEPIKSKGGKK
jgi:hypothetical protein